MDNGYDRAAASYDAQEPPDDDPEPMRCALDGDALCIFGPDFENLQESPAMFIKLTPEQIAEFEKLCAQVFWEA